MNTNPYLLQSLKKPKFARLRPFEIKTAQCDIKQSKMAKAGQNKD